MFIQSSPIGLLLEVKKTKTGIKTITGKYSKNNLISKDIVFVEIAGRSTRVVTTQGEYNSENGIDFWDSKLAAPSFFRVHKSYIVNVHYATDYSRATIVLCGEYEIPVAYRRQAEFRHFFLNYFGGR